MSRALALEGYAPVVAAAAAKETLTLKVFGRPKIAIPNSLFAPPLLIQFAVVQSTVCDI